MLFHLSTDSPVPIYEQIVGQITFAVAAGDLEPGTLIPSVRDLAQQLVVHPNTVARAVQILESNGLVTPRRGRGMEVTAEAPQRALRQRREIIQTRLRQAFREAFASHLSLDEIRQLALEELELARLPLPERDTTQVRRATPRETP